MVFSRLVSLDRSAPDDADDATPPTRSYVDALLHGNISDDELASLRAEIVGQGAASDDDDDPRTRFHEYTTEERRSARPSGHLPQVSAPDDDVIDDEARTRFHCYSPGERDSARPSGFPPALARPDTGAITAPILDDDDDARTLFRAALANAPRSAPPSRPSSIPRSPSPAPRASGALRLGGGAPPSRPPVSSSPPSGGPVSSDRRGPGSRTPPPQSAPVVHLGDLFEGAIPIPSAAPEEVYLEALGGPGSIPRLAMAPADLRRLPLDAQAGFLVSGIDGTCSVEDLVDISTQSRLDTLRMLHELLQQGVISVRG